jgi:hypothetical protein
VIISRKEFYPTIEIEKQGGKKDNPREKVNWNEVSRYANCSSPR